MIRISTFALALAAALGSLAAAAEFKLTEFDGGVRVEVDGGKFTEYLTKTGPKPILWPIIGPTGKEMTRSYPMKDVSGEKKDHPHQRSLWMTHGIVGGVDFWSEIKGHGSIAHRKYLRVQGGAAGVIESTNDWLDPDGNVVISEVRRLMFNAGDGWRAIDFESIFTPPAGKDVTFGDTKEGALGIRVPTSMDVNSKQGGKIVNSEGQTDDAAWGQRAKWVDYHGPVEGETLGVAIFNHPESFRHPTWWHVRSYGLFASNPWGLKSFIKGGAEDGSHTVKSGDKLTLKHRFFFHIGDEKQGKVAQHYDAYTAPEAAGN